jgi:acetyl esterase/lipase
VRELESGILTQAQCTGASDFIPWYSQTSVRRALAKDAIIIAPDYPLGPEGNYIDIYDAIYDFLWWYKEDGCFEDEVKGKRFKSWQDWLRYKLRDKTFTVDKNRVYIEGESAGAHAAVTAMWLNAARGEDFGINIKAALLRYPMIAHYKRELPGEGEKVGYMDEQFGRDDIQSQAKKVEEEILRLEKLGIVPTCTGRAPARGMAFAFLLSMSQIWQLLFQRDHHDPHLRTEPDPKDEKKMDGIERAWRCAESIHARLLPPIYIYHGKDDTNCPVEDTQEFVDILKNPDIYGEHFKNDDRLCLDVIKRLEKAPVWHVKENELRHEVKTEVTHGFDYWLDEENEPFLKKAYDWVGKHWDK